MFLAMSTANGIALILSFLSTVTTTPFPQMTLPLEDEAFTDTYNTNFTPLRAKYPQKCPWCQGHQISSDKSEKFLSEEDIRLLRIELVKAKILARLNLTEAPNDVEAGGGDLPSIIKEGKIPGINMESENKLPEKYQSPSIAVAESSFPCSKNSSFPSYCFKFQLENIPENSAFNPEALLWLYRSEKRKKIQHLLEISQIIDENSLAAEFTSPALTYLLDVTEGWISMNISLTQSPITSSNTVNIITLILQVSCQTCSRKRHSFPISHLYEHRPFIVTKDSVTTSLDTNHIRTIRSTDECVNNNQRCCRDSLYVDFAEFGWNNWILQPVGFTMYFCRGSCNYITTATTVRAGNSYRGLLQRLMLRPNIESSLREALAPCCSPNHKEALTVLWLPARKSSVRVTHLQDMIVKSCDCFG